MFLTVEMGNVMQREDRSSDFENLVPFSGRSAPHIWVPVQGGTLSLMNLAVIRTGNELVQLKTQNPNISFINCKCPIRRIRC
jgi:hypothetical protein